VVKKKDLEDLRDALPSVVNRGSLAISSIGFAMIVEKERRKEGEKERRNKTEEATSRCGKLR
jgi:phage head maturation protease